MSKSLVGSGMVLSKGSDAVANFIPLTRWISTADVNKNARAAIEMQGDTGSCQIAPGYQTANDQDSPDTAVKLGGLAFVGADGIQYPTGYTDISTAVDAKLLVRFGVLVKQDADGGIQGCYATIRVDLP